MSGNKGLAYQIYWHVHVKCFHLGALHRVYVMPKGESIFVGVTNHIQAMNSADTCAECGETPRL